MTETGQDDKAERHQGQREREAKGLLRFRVLGIPVTVEPSFWFITLILGASGDSSMLSLATWVLAVTISIIIHELGHALTANAFGSPPQILLHSMGGLTMHDRVPSRAKDMLVIAAGPGAGFLFIGLMFLMLHLSGRELLIHSAIPWVGWEPFAEPFTQRFLAYLAYINIGWGLINLFPVLPLDGGQIMQNILEALFGPKAGVATLAVSTVVAAGTAVFFYYRTQSVFMLLMFGYLGTISGTALFRQLKHPAGSS